MSRKAPVFAVFCLITAALSLVYLIVYQLWLQPQAYEINGYSLLYNRKKESLDDEIEELIAQRQQARKEKNFALADKIRDDLKARGIVLLDTPQGVKWKMEQ